MLRRIWKDPVWASVIATGIGGLASYLAGWWPAIVQVVKEVWIFLSGTSSISHWIVAALAFLALPTLVVGVMLAWQLVRPTAASRPDWHEYTEDSFFGLRWRWRYFDNGQIRDIHTFCPNCDFQVFPQNASAWDAVDRIRFKCDSCHSELGQFQEAFESVESKAKRFIQQKIRNGAWIGSDAGVVPTNGQTQ
jgi:hypothetical protein